MPTASFLYYFVPFAPTTTASLASLLTVLEVCNALAGMQTHTETGPFGAEVGVLVYLFRFKGPGAVDYRYFIGTVGWLTC